MCLIPNTFRASAYISYGSVSTAPKTRFGTGGATAYRSTFPLARSLSGCQRASQATSLSKYVILGRCTVNHIKRNAYALRGDIRLSERKTYTGVVLELHSANGSRWPGDDSRNSINSLFRVTPQAIRRPAKATAGTGWRKIITPLDLQKLRCSSKSATS